MVLNLFKFLGDGSGKKKTYKGAVDTSGIIKEWKNIDVLVTGGAPSQLKQALIAADKALDSVLKGKVAGETMGDRLKEAKDLFEWSFYQKIWEAHKIRNALSHEVGYEPPHHMLKSGIETLRQAVNKLGVRV